MKRNIFIIILAVNILSCMAQDFEYGMGCLPEPHPESLPAQAQLMTRDYDNLPSSYSLKKYCPTPQSQGQYGTCTSWATAYAFRTILESISRNWTDKDEITKEAFSPLFIYAQIKDPYDYNCSKGTFVSAAFKSLKNIGAAKKTLFDVYCASRIPDDVMATAAPYKIDDYKTLFVNSFMTESAKIQVVKKALCNNQPVVIAMKVYPSFNSCKDLWDGDMKGNCGYHAMCVVGYDDDQYGGAFLIMNSWGQNWGNGGFTWVKYSDFCRTVDQAYTGNLALSPSPVVKKNILGGEIELQLSTGATMAAIRDKNGNDFSYNIQGTYMSGTRFRLYLTNKEPAYVYIIGYDTKGNTDLIFPPKENISPVLTYKNTHIAIPDEKWYIEMDANEGTDYLCVLYSKKELNISNITKKIMSGNGSIQDRIKRVLGSSIASSSEIKYSDNAMSFDAETEGSVVPLIAILKHN
ncbi:MAG: DUF4384 domain-containing protein [Prevotella sp.]|nr:DUF4384 domain-containing protein [Prevotella sp.]